MNTTDDDRQIAESEFLGNAQDIGYGSGVTGESFADLLHCLLVELGRDLTADELADLEAGHAVGVADRVAYDRDMARCEPVNWDDVPF